MNHEFVDKMIKAKQMEIEAIGCLLPDPVKGHIDVINRELKDMAKEVLISCCTGGTRDTRDTRDTRGGFTNRYCCACSVSDCCRH